MKILLLFISLLASVFSQAQATSTQTTANIAHWRTQSTEGVDVESGNSSITSSLPSENLTPAKFAARSATAAINSNHVIWVYDADVNLISDIDNDGYYSRLRVRLDVDTVFSHAQVFAVVYLGDDTGYREIHTSSVFDIYLDASNDEFSFSTELLQGFRPWDYDILIEIYNANSITLEDIYNHTHDPDLSLVSLESNEFEQRHSSGSLTGQELGGSPDMSLLLGLLLFIKLRRKI